MRMLTGDDPRKSKLLRLGADLCTKKPPRGLPKPGSIDLVYWHFGTLAQHAVGGKHWKLWGTALNALTRLTPQRLPLYDR